MNFVARQLSLQPARHTAASSTPNSNRLDSLPPSADFYWHMKLMEAILGKTCPGTCIATRSDRCLETSHLATCGIAHFPELMRNLQRDPDRCPFCGEHAEDKQAHLSDHKSVNMPIPFTCWGILRGFRYDDAAVDKFVECGHMPAKPKHATNLAPKTKPAAVPVQMRPTCQPTPQIHACVDYWMPTCDGCGMSDLTAEMLRSMGVRTGKSFRSRISAAYRRPVRNHNWDGYRCYDCISRNWPRLVKSKPFCCPVCKISCNDGYMHCWSPALQADVCHVCGYENEYTRDRRTYTSIREALGIPLDDPIMALPFGQASELAKFKGYAVPRVSRMPSTLAMSAVVAPRAIQISGLLPGCGPQRHARVARWRPYIQTMSRYMPTQRVETERAKQLESDTL